MPEVDHYDKLLQEDLNVGTGPVTKRNPAGGSLTGTQVGIHTFAIGQAAAEVTWDPGTLAALASATKRVTVPGAVLGDFAMASFEASLSGLVPAPSGSILMTAFVSEADTVTVLMFNAGSAPISPGSSTLRVLAFKSK